MATRSGCMAQLARLEEIRLGHALVAGRHDRAIAKALRKEGHRQEAEQVEALIPPSDSARPRAAYTSQARRMADRHVDLATRKTLVATLWPRSDGLTSFRATLAEHGLSMREGDRNGTRPGAHIIETGDGVLVGSFTRLTKVRMAEFRQLLANEQSLAKARSKLDIGSTRVPVRITSKDYQAGLVPRPRCSSARTRPAARIRLPRLDRQLEEVRRRRMEDVDRPSVLPESPRAPPLPLILSAEDSAIRRRIRELVKE
ncbi:hypothetical protein [Acetobacter sp. DsW_063]|uniref:hypothetical protein n=1 Tax=Acetobacter sp. DsW_063 TaxID=1514894 RepID=UPI00117863C4|nr:hypothetical protein [Acetobacter sp. DsW_063]